MEFMYPSRGRRFGTDAALGVSKQYLYDLLVLSVLLEGELEHNSTEPDVLCSALQLISPVVYGSDYEMKAEFQDLLSAAEELARQMPANDAEESFEFDIE